MSTGQKVALAVLVLLGLCFVVAVVLPGRVGAGTGSTDEAAEQAGELITASASVTRSELTGCFQGELIQFVGDCTLTVAPSTQSLRILRLLPRQPVELEAPAPRIDDFTIEADLESDREISIAVDERGGAIELGCAALGGCVVEVR